MIGIPELLLILVIILIVFGAGKLPEIGEALGKGIRAFKSANSGKDPIDVTPSAERLEQPAPRREKSAAAAPAKEKVAAPAAATPEPSDDEPV